MPRLQFFNNKTPTETYIPYVSVDIKHQLLTALTSAGLVIKKHMYS